MNVAKCDPLHDPVHKKPENRGKVLRGPSLLSFGNKVVRDCSATYHHNWSGPRQPARQTDRKDEKKDRDRDMHAPTYRQTNRKTDSMRQTYRQIERQRQRHIHTYMNTDARETD